MTDRKEGISRVRRSKTVTRANYNRLSRWYDLIASPFEKRLRNVGLKKLDPIPGECVLEIGYGTGQGIVRLANAVGDQGEVYGIDISEGMYRKASTRVRRAVPNGKVCLVCADAARLPYCDQQFDAIFMSFTLELFDAPEIPVVLSECRRVLKQEGRIAVVALSRSRNPTTMERMYEWVHEKLPSYLDCRPIFVEDSLTNAGFEITERLRKKMWGLPVAIVVAIPTKPR